jgi:hypothetical protein
MNEKSQGNKGKTVFRREKERKSTGNHERGIGQQKAQRSRNVRQ